MTDQREISENGGEAGIDSGLACLALLAKYFEKPGDYQQLRHRHGAPLEAADDIDQLWVADITYLHLAEEFAYLTTAMPTNWPSRSAISRPGLPPSRPRRPISRMRASSSGRSSGDSAPSSGDSEFRWSSGDSAPIDTGRTPAEDGA